MQACTCSGLPIVVKRSEVEKNFNAMAEAAGGSALSANAERRVYLGNLPRGMNEGDVRSIGATVGLIDKVMVNRDSRGEPTGTAYITYSVCNATLAAAAAAVLSCKHACALAVGSVFCCCCCCRRLTWRSKRLGC
ncbi:hypothetical protein EON67_11775 [archaeon]|nr:MAG: hypothetical protein EON67_11775 [archaeon]